MTFLSNFYIRPTKIRPKADNSLARHPFSYKERSYWNSPFRGAKFSGGKGQAVVVASNCFSTLDSVPTFALLSRFVPWNGLDDPWPRLPRRLPAWSVRVSNTVPRVCPPIKAFHPTMVIPVVPISCDILVTTRVDLHDRCDPATVDSNWSHNRSSYRRYKWANASILSPRERATGACSLPFFLLIFLNFSF